LPQGKPKQRYDCIDRVTDLFSVAAKDQPDGTYIVPICFPVRKQSKRPHPPTPRQINKNLRKKQEDKISVSVANSGLTK